MRLPCWSWLWFFCLLVPLCVGESPAQRIGPAAAPTHSVLREGGNPLLTKAKTAGHIRILVRLNMPFQPAGQLSAPEAAEQQARIADLQNQLCAALSGTQVTGVKRFQYTPLMGMIVDAAALERLLAHPLVLSIEEDTPAPPAKEGPPPLK